MPLQIQRPLGLCLVQGCIQVGTDSPLTCRENPLAFRVGGDLGQVLLREDHHNTCELPFDRISGSLCSSGQDCALTVRILG